MGIMVSSLLWVMQDLYHQLTNTLLAQKSLAIHVLKKARAPIEQPGSEEVYVIPAVVVGLIDHTLDVL